MKPCLAQAGAQDGPKLVLVLVASDLGHEPILRKPRWIVPGGVHHAHTCPRTEGESTASRVIAGPGPASHWGGEWATGDQNGCFLPNLARIFPVAHPTGRQKVRQSWETQLRLAKLIHYKAIADPLYSGCVWDKAEEGPAQKSTGTRPGRAIWPAGDADST